ncbi:hydrogenase small subunit [Desulfococcaceae bacterium HSG8]|nr:hydrogenase small subunit [Desulfococcaceae bacterium HSG8]
MKISRRSFLKYCIGSAAALGLDLSVVGRLERAIAGDLSMPTVIWIEGASCSGCSVALANLIGTSSDGGPTDVADLLINYLNVSFAKTYMSAAGDLAVTALREAQKRSYILVVEGGIPTAFDGMTCTVFSENGTDITMKDAMLDLAPGASSVICAGTCSSFGGIPATGSNPLEIRSVSELTGIQTINIPGCPVHPDWLVGTIASVLCGKIPSTDSNGRPTAFYGRTVHSQCPRKPLYDKNSFADNFGQEGRCLKQLGCNGPETYADCPSRGWNNGFNYCVQSNANCIGCVEPDFPKSELVIRNA